MPTPGYVFKDGGIEDNTTSSTHPDSPAQPSTVTHQQQFADGEKLKLVSASEEAPTESHALAMAEHEWKGAAQEAHGAVEVRDVGWNTIPKDTESLVGGLPNEELWTLIRRFNKQMYHVKALEETPPGGLDLCIASEDEFSPDKLRSTIERLYMTVGVGMVAFAKHIARLRSWREARRTAAFCTVYFFAWLFDVLVPTFLGLLAIVIVYPPARSALFPPAPIALVDSDTGGIQKPKAEVLGSHDSVTGAPEKHQGEAVEQEASNFVSGIASVALSSAAGKHDQSTPEGDPLDSAVPDPTAIATTVRDSKDSAKGGIPTPSHDKTKKPMEDTIWTKMRPALYALGAIADAWERFANALSPTSPFPQHSPRIRLASLIVPGIAVSLFVTSSMFMKMTTFGIGAGFFGDPIVRRGIKLLNKKFPHWQNLLEFRNTVLRGVPTNAQLAITLLRIGEVNRSPLPPPPRSDDPPPDRPADLNKNDLTVDASNREIDDAIKPPSDDTTTTADEPTKKTPGSRFLGLLKGTTKSGVETKLGLDHVRAKTGSDHAKQRLGILPNPKRHTTPSDGPVIFRGRHKGRKGVVRITTSTSTSTTPIVSFSLSSSSAAAGATTTTGRDTDSGHRDQDKKDIAKTDEDDNEEEEEEEEEQEENAKREKKSVVFSIPVRDIVELKKLGGLGWKGKLVVGWATDKEVADGLEIVEKKSGRRWTVTAIRERDELFNRLVAMGEQRWASC